jgi:hypothetical protein
MVLLTLLLIGTRSASCAELAEEPPPLYSVEWSRLLGGKGDVLTKFAVASDGRIWLVGSAASESDDAHGGGDGWVAVLDADGVPLWSKRYGGSDGDRLFDVALLSDGGAVILGETESSNGQVKNYRGGVDAWVIRVDAQGALVWQKCLGGTLDDNLTAMRIVTNVAVDENTTEDRVILAGWSMSYNNDLNLNEGGKDAWVCAIRLDSGRSLWHYQTGGVSDDWFDILLPEQQGMTAIGGTTLEDAQGGQRVVPVLTSIGADGGEGAIIRIQLKEDAWISDAAQTTDGWILAGRTGVENSDAWLSRVSPDGSFNTIYMEGNTNGAMSIIRQYTFSIALAVGTLDSEGSRLTGVHGGRDVWTVGLTRDRVQWEQALGGSGETTPLFVTRRSDGRYVIAMSTTSADGDLPPHEQNCVGWIVLLDVNGNLLRQAIIAPYADQRFTSATTAATDSSVIFLGEAMDETGVWRAAIVKATAH